MTLAGEQQPMADPELTVKPAARGWVYCLNR